MNQLGAPSDDLHAFSTKPSAFLRHAAECIATGKRISHKAASGWVEYICMTLPPIESWNQREVCETRVMRFLLAAEVAEGEGN